MLALQQQRACQRSLLLGGLAVTLYFFFVYRPMTKRTDALDAPLTNAWQKLVTAEVDRSAINARDLARIGENLRQVERSVALLESTAQRLAGRIELDTPVRAKLKEPFQLIDFQNERQLRMEELVRMARQQQVTMDGTVLAGFPEYTADRKQPELLWVQLAIVNKLLSAAIACKVTVIKSLSVEPFEPHRSSGEGREFLEEIPVRIEVAGSMESVSRFLLCLPLRADELKPLGLPESFPAKPVLFIDRLMLRKQAPEKTDDVQLELRTRGIVNRDQALTNG
jgi:hypothetical protein